MPEERVQKILARAGYGSRRANEELITAGRVKINGQAAVLGSKADPQRDTITVDNQPIAREQPPVYIALNKPQGVLSEVSPEEPRQTVRDLVPVPGHMFIVGRLDLESEGLILLTNDGELANRLSHPRYGHEKEYRVLVGARPDNDQLEAWRHGVVLEDGYRTAPAQVRVESLAGKGAWLEVILHEGRKRQIREMGKLTGMHVQRIVRVRIGTLLLGDLKPGAWRALRPEEVRALKAGRTGRGPRRETARPRTGRRPGFHPEEERSTRAHRPDTKYPLHASHPVAVKHPASARPSGSRHQPDASQPTDVSHSPDAKRRPPRRAPQHEPHRAERAPRAERERSSERSHSSDRERSSDRSGTPSRHRTAERAYPPTSERRPGPGRPRPGAPAGRRSEEERETPRPTRGGPPRRNPRSRP